MDLHIKISNERIRKEGGGPDLPKKYINEIIKVKSTITSENALKLERSLGRPTRFWNNL